MRAERGRLLSWPEVRERVAISRTTAWRLQRAGSFPLPVMISAGRVGWREEEITAWTASLAKRKLNKAGAAQVDEPPQAAAAALATTIIAAEGGRARPLKFVSSRRQAGAPTQQLGFDF